MKRILLFLCGVSLGCGQQLTPEQQKQIDAALPAKAAAKPKSARRILVVTLAKVNDRVVRGHPSIPAANYALEQMGKEQESNVIGKALHTVRVAPGNQAGVSVKKDALIVSYAPKGGPSARPSSLAIAHALEEAF